VNRTASIEDLLREATPRVLGSVARRFGDFSDSEDAVQEALLAAACQWPIQGTPENPVGWLIHVASRRMIDRLRSERARRTREELTAAQEVPAADAPLDPDELQTGQDDTLILMFMCAHPALTEASTIALTLRAVGGLTTLEIANAFMVPEATMAQRIGRAKQSIKTSGISFAMPEPEEWTVRLRSVMHVLYLIFNEGYLSSSGSRLARGELSAEAIRLTRVVHRDLPEDPEVTGLLALMLLSEARRPARTDADSELIPLADQDRNLWSQDLIAEGLAAIAEAWKKGTVGEYQLQAAIAAVHDQARRSQDTDWREILALYGLLERMSANPMVTLNRAIATAMADGPAAGLELLAALEQPLAGHHRLHATRAHLLEMAGQTDAAIVDYLTAADLTTSQPEQHYLLKQAAHLRSPTSNQRDDNIPVQDSSDQDN
jgi:RNA polymerase sigma factor (sigma-70 family)